MYYDLITLVVFFGIYHVWGFQYALISTCLFALIPFIRSFWQYLNHQPITLNSMQKWSYGSVLVLGGLSIFFQNPLFIQWKLSAFYGFLGLWIGYRSLKKKPSYIALLKIDLDPEDHCILDRGWCLFFIALSITNAFIVVLCKLDTWITFKVIIMPIALMAWAIMQILYLGHRRRIRHRIRSLETSALPPSSLH